MTVFSWIVGLLCIVAGVFTFLKGNSSQGWLLVVCGIAVGFVGMAWKNRRRKQG
jgi:ABC-type Mn2+/Zn2+ transport system permease subunit